MASDRRDNKATTAPTRYQVDLRFQYQNLKHVL